MPSGNLIGDVTVSSTNFSRSGAYYTFRAWVPQHHFAWSNCHSGYCWSYELVDLLTLGRGKMSLNGRWSPLVFRNTLDFWQISLSWYRTLHAYNSHGRVSKPILSWWTFEWSFYQLVTKELLAENWHSGSIFTGETRWESFGHKLIEEPGYNIQLTMSLTRILQVMSRHLSIDLFGICLCSSPSLRARSSKLSVI